MKIVLLNGSPNPSDAATHLADRFAAGAMEAGHTVLRFDAAFKDIHPCNGCDSCGLNGPCVYKDDIEKELIMELVDCDLIALVSPLYFLGLSAQLKTIIDRFYSRTYRINNKQTILMVTSEDSGEKVLAPIRSHYATLIRYMHWHGVGNIYAAGFATGQQIADSPHAQEAYNLGLNLK